MRRLFTAFVSLGLALSLVACPDPKFVEPPYVENDAGDYPAPPNYELVEHTEGSAAAAASPCGKACTTLRAIGCPEGFPTVRGVSCYKGCLSMARHQRVPTACWSASKTQSDVRKCGGIQCLVAATESSATHPASPN